MARNISLFKRIKNGFKEVITFDKRFFFNYKHNTTKNHFSIILFKTTKKGARSFKDTLRINCDRRPFG